MSNRHLSRTLVLQTLFQWDFNEKKEDLNKLLEANKKEFAAGLDDQNFAKDLIDGITKNISEIDQLITDYAPEWPIDQITGIDRNTLRIGIYELRYSPEIPPKVAINEAIELAKNYSGPSAGRFVNGVLGSIYKAMQNQGEKKEFEQEPERIHSCGGVVYQKTDESYKFILVLDGYNKWTFPKGSMEKGENKEQTALREITEEVGVKNLTIKGYLGEIDIKVSQPNKPPTPKTVYYFLIATNDQPLKIAKSPGVLDAKWVTAEQATSLISYENAKQIFLKAVEQLRIKI